MTMNSRRRKVLLLAELQPGDLVIVSKKSTVLPAVIVFGSPVLLPPGNGTMRLRKGEVLHCIERLPSDTLVARSDGTQFLVAHALGKGIEVELFFRDSDGRLETDGIRGHAS